MSWSVKIGNGIKGTARYPTGWTRFQRSISNINTGRQNTNPGAESIAPPTVFVFPTNDGLTDRLDQLTLQPSYTIADTEDNRDIEYYNLSVGWTHIFSDTLTMRNFVGYGQTITKENGNQDSTWTGNADLSITRTGEIYSFRIGIRNNINLNADGELEEVDRLYCYINKKLTERLSANLYGSVYTNRPPGTYNSVDSIFYDVKPELSYDITENHVLNVFYRYSYEEDRTISENQERTRNVIELNLVFQYPMQK